MSANDEDSVGVIVARFHVPELHEGHRHTIEEALKRHKTILFILGVAYDSDDADPLSFEMRRMMVQSRYPNSNFLFVPSDSLASSTLRRSAMLDELIAKTVPGRTVVLYGARDSIVHKYVGIHPLVELPTVYAGSATEIRNAIEIVDSVDFRKGVIYNVLHRKAVSYPTVDVGIVRGNVGKVLLAGWKDDEGKLRFPGCFFMPELDDSYESAAWRCVGKETPGIRVGRPRLVASTKIVDPRYRKSKNGIVTTMTHATCNDDRCVATPGEGVDHLEWVAFEQVPEVLVDAHKPLGEIMRHRWRG